ncbi:hypothetical protein JXA40_07110 [bacterium]|nr:hypothetical protein [candidate division CSSED10-310 bacterium]
MTKRMIAVFLILMATAPIIAHEEETEEQTGKKEVVTMEEKLQAMHQYMSVESFNRCWTLIDKQDRTPEDIENMVLLAHVSLWHWKQRTDCTSQNLSVGYWQVSRVCALAGDIANARQYGEKCREVSERNNLPPFYFGYAYEALARAERTNHDTGKAKQWLSQARSQLEKVKDPESQKLLQADLDELEESIRDGD